MNDVDRFIGAFQEFREWEKVEHDNIHSELKEIHKKLDKLNNFKIKVVASVSAVLAVYGIVAKLWHQ